MRMRKKTWGAGVVAGAALATIAGVASATPAAMAAPSRPATGTAATGPAATGTAATSPGGTSSPAGGTLAPPPVTVLTDRGGNGGGDIFIAPYGDSSSYANGAEILSPDGKKVVWFHPAPAGEEDADFRTQTYDGQQVLTFWQGTGLGGVSTGTDYIYNRHYQQIAAIRAGNGYSADGHEFLITGRNTALILSYTTATANLTSIGGPADQAVIDGVVQEVDIKTGKVLFQWNSADHVPYSQSEQPLPASASTPWDWFHVNAVKVNTDGSFLIDARDTWTTYDVSPRTGKINWRLGGKDSSFTLKAGAGQVLNDAGDIFAWQHDVEGHGNGVYTVFDNESAGTGNTGTGASSELAYSRAATIKLNLATHTATLLAADNQPEGLIATSQGNAQLLPSGDEVVGWGALPYFSEFSPSGQLEFNAELPAGVNTYRAYRLPWSPSGPRR
ncbi:MAG TPA: arylsulfotransferase family protein [Trebonia sp.]|nr:arylsulfotransferase family protein [Trebonia sp.]